MYAIVEVAGQQFKVEKGQKIFVHRLENKEGTKVDFDQVMLIDNEGKVTVGEPVINGAAVTAKVLEHQRGDKVVVFKKKRRKGYQVRNGHRQDFTQIQIESIVEKGAKKAAAPKAEAKKEEAPKAEVKKPAAKKAAAKPAAEKKAAAPKAEAKKPAAKKPAAKKTTAAKTTASKTTAAKKPAAKKPAAKKEDKK